MAKPRRDKEAELYAMARDLTVPDVDFARAALSLTKRMNDINRSFVISFAGFFREHAKKQRVAAKKEEG